MLCLVVKFSNFDTRLIFVVVSFLILIYALLTKREVKMAGYWPSSFSAFLWTETKSRSVKTQKKKKKKKKKRTRPIFSHLDRTSLVNKGFRLLQRLGECFPLVILKINRSILIFVHLVLSDACNNQCFINCFIL